MKRILLLISTIIIVSTNLHAQVFEQIHIEDTVKIIGIVDDGISRTLEVVENYDDYGLYINIYDNSSNYMLLDDNMNIVRDDNELDSLSRIKYRVGNNLYRFGGYHIGDYTFGYFDYLYLSRFNSNGVLISTDTIMRASEDTINWSGQYNTLMLEDKTFLLILSAQIHDFITPASAAKIIRFDTLGNVLASKIFYNQNNYLDICEMKNNIMFAISGAPSTNYRYDNNYIYYLNKETLDIEDSIIGYRPAHMKGINDSLMAFTYEFAKFNNSLLDTVEVINLLNVKTKRLSIVTLDFPDPDVSEVTINIGDYYDRFSKMKIIDCLNPDSIYACYYMSNSVSSNYYGALEICNFDLWGNVNYVYRINFNTEKSKDIKGIKATKDGGLLIAAHVSNNNASIHNVWLIKFHPQGILDFTNVETGEKETIKVYPNPAKDFVYVDIEATNFTKGEIELFDMQGKFVKKAKLSAKQGNRVDVSNLNAGAYTYTYNVSLNGKTISGKVIVGK
ncbi:MAG: T9SS type A sorting domain-containing protein [Bacteroidales bacterium]|nr:T9SS type A sorting domain-containing protein [Bacteroidales bacterium]MDD4738751.1 T9SS type A sorting domain-containing protein [Bacteroidales bacterium]